MVELSDRAVDLGTIAAYDISPVMMELFGLRQPAYFQFLGRQLRAAYRANTRGTILEKDGTASNELTPCSRSGAMSTGCSSTTSCSAKAMP